MGTAAEEWQQEKRPAGCGIRAVTHGQCISYSFRASSPSSPVSPLGFLSGAVVLHWLTDDKTRWAAGCITPSHPHEGGVRSLASPWCMPIHSFAHSFAHSFRHTRFIRGLWRQVHHSHHHSLLDMLTRLEKLRQSLQFMFAKFSRHCILFIEQMQSEHWKNWVRHKQMGHKGRAWGTNGE